jgi:iron complex transport system ATP-binding protein
MMEKREAAIELEALSVGYRKGSGYLTILSNVNATLGKGEMVCLVGKNGIGKSTLLRSIAGIQGILGGKVLIHGRDITSYRLHELSRTVSLVLTDRIFAGNLKVEELVSLGRHPYTNWLGNLASRDKQKIEWALDISGVADFRDRSILELSDGQFQKVLIARALAQDGDIIILDEPTAHLDLPNKITILKLLKDLCDQTGKSILLATHELEYAFQMADRIWMVLAESELLSGCPEDLMLNHSFEKLIDHEAIRFNMANGRFSINHEKRWFCNLEGDPVGVFWTANALHRLHWEMTGDESDVKIRSFKQNGNYLWRMKHQGIESEFQSMEKRISALNELTNK